MQTLGQRVSELTAKSITSSSTPLSEDDVSSFLKDGVRDFTYRVLLSQNPNILSMLTTTKTDTGSGIGIDNGFLVSVVRNEGSASTTLNPATVIDASLRGRAADTNSLFFQSKYNPVYYILNGVVNTLPVPSSSTDYSEVSYISSEEAVTNANFNAIEIANFPKTFSGVIVYYAAAMACIAYASEVHNTLDGLSFPTVPLFSGSLPTFSVTFTETLPTSPVLPTPPTFTAPTFVSPAITKIDTPTITLPTAPASIADLSLPSELDGLTLPSVPVFGAPTLTFSLTDVNTEIGNEDLDMVEKQFEKISKNMEKFEKDMNIAKETYNANLQEFNKEFDRLDKNNERSISAKLSVYRENVSKYEKDLSKYIAELSEYTQQIAKYTADVNKFEKETTLDLGKFSQESTVNLNKFTQKATLDINKYSQEATLVISKFTQEINRYNSALNKYQMDLTSFQAEFKSYDSQIAKYQADVGKYSAELQKYSLEMNIHGTKYGWYIQKYQLFYNQYLASVTSGQPAQQQAEK